MFIPVFLVSVGPDPQPGRDGEGGKRWNSPGLFIPGVPGRQDAGGGILSTAARDSRDRRRGLLFSLSAAQAAATLAATVIGFQLGLFDSAVVNAILVVILVSVLASTDRRNALERPAAALSTNTVPSRWARAWWSASAIPRWPGGRCQSRVRIARADGGVVAPVLVLPESAPIASRAAA